MPGFYAEGEYDLSGCAVGIVKKDSVINGKNIVAGDVLIGLPSSGVHSNGFSLVRRLVLLKEKANIFPAFIYVINLNFIFSCLTLQFSRITNFLLLYLYRVLAHSGLSLKDQLPGKSVTLGEALMAPTVIYVKQVNLKS